MSLFKRKKAGEEANTIPEAMDDITQTLLIPVKDEGEKTMCVDAYETSQAEIASYTSIGTRKSQQDSICFDFGDFCTVCAVCDGMGGLTGGERASALAAHGVTRYLLEHAQAEDIPTEMGRAALRLNEEVKNLRDPANQKIEAGTTLTTVFLRNGKLFWCSIGDSHIYLYEEMLHLILETLDIHIPIQYTPRCRRTMNAEAYGPTEPGILIDELFEYTIISFLFTMYSLAYDQSEENTIRCMKNFYVIEDLQRRQHQFGTHNQEQLYRMSMLPENLMHTAMDNYWTIWTFVVGHELYHLMNPEDQEGKKTEFRADRYAYQLLIKLIMKQKAGEIPEQLRVFYECQYLAPAILFEMFRLFDVYSELRGLEVNLSSHPAPIERQKNILELSDTDVPEEMETKDGNLLLNCILDSSEMAENWLRDKIRKGKLHPLDTLG